MNITATERLRDLLAYLDGAYAPNTLRAYRTDMREFITYCECCRTNALPASPSTVADFLMSTLSQDIKTSTIKRKVSSISAIHRLCGLEDPTKHPMVKIAQRKIYRQLGTRFEQAYPVNRQLLEKMLTTCSQDLRGLRNRALLLVAYESMRRRSELVSLRIEDIEWGFQEDSSIFLRKSKTDQHGCGKWSHLSNLATTAIKNWISAAGISKGFVFRGIKPGGVIQDSLSECRVPRIFKSLAKHAGIDERIVQNIRGHSMRVGGAQDLLIQGASLPQIMVKGGWAKTDTVMRYVERSRLIYDTRNQ